VTISTLLAARITGALEAAKPVLRSRFEADSPAPSHAAPDPATTPNDGAAGFVESVRELSSPVAAPAVRSDISSRAPRRQETPSAPVPDSISPSHAAPASNPPGHDLPDGRVHIVSTPPTVGFTTRLRGSLRLRIRT
jgi:hypothetical protein